MRFFSQPAVRARVAPYLDDLPGDVLYSPRGTGLSHDAELRALARLGYLDGKSALIVGVGGGDEIIQHWTTTGVARITAIDLVREIEYKESVGWPAVQDVAAAAGVPVAFALGDGYRLPFVDRSFDLVYSHALLEHVADLPSFLGEMQRVIRPNGAIYAAIGPLWHTCHGPHVNLYYDHLLLPRADFLEKVRVVADPWLVEWIEQDFFNRLQVEDYLGHFRKFFDLRRVAIVESVEARRFRDNNPDTWAELAKEFGERALLTQSLLVIAERR